MGWSFKSKEKLLQELGRVESFCAELQLLHKILCLKDLCSSPDSSELFLSLSTPSFVFTNVHFFPVFICDPKITFAY